MAGRARGPGPRSIEALGWVDRLEVVGLEPLGLVLGTKSATTYSHVSRLVAAGFAERVFDPEGTVVAITAAGRRALRTDGRSLALHSGSARGAQRAHSRAVSWVAALVTLRGREWVSDREAGRRDEWLVPVLSHVGRGRHRPDLGVSVAGVRVAVEVELSHKKAARWRAILSGYANLVAVGRLTGGVLYVSDRPDVLAAVGRAAAAAGLSDRHFKTRSLNAVQHDVRTLSLATSERGVPVEPPFERPRSGAV